MAKKHPKETIREQKSQKLSNWLEDIQQESWQMELLISGFVIFGLFAAKPYLNKITDLLISSNDFALFLGGIISSSLPLAWFIFVTNLILHVIIRGIWIGSIGLRSVSGDIDYDKLDYSAPFTSYYKRKHGSFDNFIDVLEKISSIIFSITFLLFFILFSNLIFIALNIFLVNTYIDDSVFILVRILCSILFIILMLGGILVSIDFISFGALKRIKNSFFSKSYFKLNRIVTLITFSYFWRPILLNILDDSFSKKMYMMSLPYALVVSFFIPNLFFHSSSFYPDFKRDSRFESIIARESYNYTYYQDELIAHTGGIKDIELPAIQLSSKSINGDLIEVFVKAQRIDDELLENQGDLISPLYEKGVQNSITSSFMDGWNSFYEDTIVTNNESDFTPSEFRFSNNIRMIKSTIINFCDFYINDEKIPKENISCDFYIHPVNKTRGMWCTIKIDSLKSGRHFLGFRRISEIASTDQSPSYQRIKIPFVYKR